MSAPPPVPAPAAVPVPAAVSAPTAAPPPAPGPPRRRRWPWVLLAVLALAAAVLGWRRFGPGAAPAAAGAAARPAETVIELATGDLARAQETGFSRSLALTGTLRAVRTAVVKARVAGELRTLSVREGERVRAGQLIGSIDPTEAALRVRQADEQAAAAQSQLDIAQRTLDNNRALVEQGFISKNALDTAGSQAGGARASLQAARAAADLARKSLRDAEVRAPIDGYVAQRLAQPGERVGVDARLVEIVDLAALELETALAPDDAVQVRVGQRAQVRVDGLAAPLPATVARINPSAQAGSRSVTAYLALDPGVAAGDGSVAGGGVLRQGLFARATVELQGRRALVVPTSALRLEQALPSVLTVDGGRVVRRAVQVGAPGQARFDGDAEAAVEITGGLAAGAVVLRGTVGALRDGARVALPAVAAAAPAASVASTSAPAVAASARASPVSSTPPSPAPPSSPARPSSPTAAGPSAAASR